ncbi:DNA-binding transcriptional regulator, CsgD family [Granulicella rosea]|uniref:DNA-binding transcriptional regulator, CsgD family n=1 Tax=Granulicella rosea TaxID=474952 RepID=A0A239LH88_9BACT|nr:helix-turn-helix transcriptional regulator [Granulicella rosea]SNT29976.1 DNA-binding transcriptional regulator, CsgD family [Granulicella rosea]
MVQTSAVSAPQLPELIETIYAAVHAPELWPHALDRVAAAIGGRQTVLFTDASVSGMPGVLRSAGTDPVLIDKLLAHYGGVNILSEPCDAMFPTGSVRYSHLAVPDAEFERSEFYHDFFRPHDMYYSCGIKIALSGAAAGQAPSYLSFQRPRSASAFDVEEGLVLSALAPHLRRAFALHRRMAELQTGIAGLEAALTAFDHVVFGLDARKRVVVTNPEAQAILRAGVTLRLKNDRLAAVDPRQNEELQRLIAQAVGEGTRVYAPRQGAMRLERKPGEPLYLAASSFPGAPGRGRQALAATIVLHDPAKRPLSRAAVLRSLYGLTATENRVADLLLQGLDAREISLQIRLTLETARFHVKRVLAKTGTRRQSELIRLMLSLPGMG